MLRREERWPIADIRDKTKMLPGQADGLRAKGLARGAVRDSRRAEQCHTSQNGKGRVPVTVIGS